MKIFITAFGLAALMVSFAEPSTAGAAYCRFIDSSGGIDTTYVSDKGSGYSAYNTAIVRVPAGGLCWSSANREHGYAVAIQTSGSVGTLNNGRKHREVAAGFGANRNEAMRNAINALRRNAILWNANDGYTILHDRKF